MIISFEIQLSLFILIAFLNLNKVKGDEYEYKLIRDLLKDYNQYARPSLNFRDPTNVTFHLSLSQLIDVDEKNQIITTNCWLSMFWIDHKLKWNSSEYGGLTEIRLPYNLIWKPDVILYNNADTLASLSQISTQMVIESSGNVTWLSTSIFKSSCSINVEHFPFDEQNCSLSFASWTYDGNGINLLKNSETGDISNYVPNGEWTLEKLLVERNIKIYSCCPVPFPNVTYYIVIKRRPLFYVFNMIFPSMLITIVGFLGFLIPPDSGEKVSMGVTTLLSMTVFLMVVAENMPPNSDSVPLIASYYLGSMFIISLATAGTVFTLNTFKKGDAGKPVPPWLQKIFFDFVARLLFMKIEINRNLKLSVEEAFPNEKYNVYVKKLNNSSSSNNNNNNNSNGHVIEQATSKKTTPTQANASDKSTNKRLKNPNMFISKEVHVNRRGYFDSDVLKSAHERANANKLLLKSSPIFQNRPKCAAAQNEHDELDWSRSFSRSTSNSFSKQQERNFESSSLIVKSVEQGHRCCRNLRDIYHDQRKLAKLLKSLTVKIDSNDSNELKAQYREEIKNQWTQLANVYDTLMAYAFVITSVSITIYFYYKTPNVRIM